MNRKKKNRKLIIDKERCKGCMLCINICPKGLLKVSEGVNEKGYQYVVLERPEECNACGLCAKMCPDCGLEIIEE